MWRWRMMSKVKLTQEQAEIIEETKFALAGFSNDILVRCLNGEYEVETRFKAGDWVITGRGVIGKYKNESNGIYEFTSSDGYYATSDNLRHATPKEIKTEKRRRWWKKHGRDVWELREGDILSEKGYPRVVEKVKDTFVTFKDGSWENANTVKSFLKVVCFAENREDVKDDE